VLAALLFEEDRYDAFTRASWWSDNTPLLAAGLNSLTRTMGRVLSKVTVWHL